jgi:hypothetical protein
LIVSPKERQEGFIYIRLPRSEAATYLPPNAGSEPAIGLPLNTWWTTPEHVAAFPTPVLDIPTLEQL